MKKFDFSLETVLRFRMAEEREWENKLLIISGQCLQLKQRIAHFEAEKSRCATNSSSKEINALMAVENYRARMDQQIKAVRQSLAEKEKERLSLLESFIEVSKKRKILDKLKEKKWEDYRSLQKKDEEKRNNDINTARWANAIS